MLPEERDNEAGKAGKRRKKPRSVEFLRKFM
jgi:hypothetical protein